MYHTAVIKTVIIVMCVLSKNIGYQQVHLAFFVKTAFQFYTTANPNNDMFSA